MSQLVFGNHPRLTFSSESEMYESIGYLAKKRGLSVRREDNQNQGAWAPEYRIYVYDSLDNASVALLNKASKGVGNAVARINCNEFICLLFASYGFVMGDNQDINTIRATIPRIYLSDFERGVVLAS
ncbi:hypothetical protein [Vibrio cyclitrophicus]|uniref:hypothetical protein n=1 Tax=Vibrio cyclitrophicus TaxID=47951 RepID=UPI000C867085|nr:hypothetical protein [Vibrio cyclitrophicus]PME70255.1 hypothetical protein BCV31_20340 [Vibrio cyclitrophicus]